MASDPDAPTLGSDAPSGDATLLQPGQALGPRYRIIRLIGAGGMGAVYEAEDHELGVTVALKVIRRDTAGDPVTARDWERRFKRELLLARRVTHRNVVRIHDIGEVDGLKYITMSYIEGADLATVLRDAGRLPIARTLKLARSIVAGLQAAHEAGIVHRDLKPANVMVDAQDEAYVMDFGIALASGESDGAPAGPQTRSRVPAFDGATKSQGVVGTIEYMAPEQFRGQTVDQRADIYAFGLMLYDMLSGVRRSDHTRTPLDELTGRMKAAPPPLRTLDADIPEALEKVVARAVDPDPAARFQTTADLAAALHGLDDRGRRLPVLRRFSPLQLAGAVAVAVVSLVGAWWYTRPPVAPAVQSFLVANFDNESGNPVFDGAVEEAVTIALEESGFLTAYQRSDALRIATQIGAGDTLNEPAARLVSAREGVNLVVTGTIAKDGAGYALAIRAVAPGEDESGDRTVASARTTAASEQDTLGAVVSLVARVRTALGDADPDSGTLAQPETFTAGSLNAMRAYARGQRLFYEGQDEEALAAYREAIGYDANFGRAYAGMAGIYQHRQQQTEMAAAYDQALQHLDRMTERERYRTLGAYYVLVARNYPSAIENYEALVSKYPADNAGHANLALAYLYTRDMARAVEEGRRAIEIYPENRLQRANYASYAMYAGDNETAIRESKTVLGALVNAGSPAPSGAVDVFAFLTLARASAAAGDIAGAEAAYARLAAAGGVAASLASLGRADIAMEGGRYREAVDLLNAGIAADRADHDAEAEASKQVALAESRLAMGDTAGAAEAAGRVAALRTHESVLVPAALVLVEAGKTDQAAAIADTLRNLLQSQTTSYAELIQAEIALKAGRRADAFDQMRAAQDRYDSWLGHYLLGRAHLDAGQAVEAIGEFQRCLDRQGEATDVFIDDKSTLHDLPPVYYWLAKASEQIGGTAAARANYQRYVDLRADADPPDPLAAEATERLDALPH